ncbi:MAG: hypothetical protein IFJ97_00765 [Acidobacteria bacterium]|uniref:Uncharacterized protein n=1 Tax=Candidatus Sulfomarinibacter kjeldsenii TaxID=2885994 RepID=A0A8J6Y492_9BACT|nr:hypothetical protein [Candidatus Sulfomarinibacter kjeldsenii]
MKEDGESPWQKTAQPYVPLVTILALARSTRPSRQIQISSAVALHGGAMGEERFEAEIAFPEHGRV